MTTAGKPSVPEPISHEEIDRILAGQHHDPHAVLGAHPLGVGSGPNDTVIRTLWPLAWSVDLVLFDGSRHPMTHVHEGVFSAAVPAGIPVSGYRLDVFFRAGGRDLLVDHP